MATNNMSIPRMDAYDIGWLAGIIEGEGCISVYKEALTRWRPRLVVGMTDEDVIRRCFAITGEGSVYGPMRNGKAHYKSVWSWSVHHKRGIVRILLAVAPLLGERRRSQIVRCLGVLEKMTTYARDGEPIKHGSNKTNASRCYREFGRMCSPCAKADYAHRKAQPGYAERRKARRKKGGTPWLLPK